MCIRDSSKLGVGKLRRGYISHFQGFVITFPSFCGRSLQSWCNFHSNIIDFPMRIQWCTIWCPLQKWTKSMKIEWNSVQLWSDLQKKLGKVVTNPWKWAIHPRRSLSTPSFKSWGHRESIFPKRSKLMHPDKKWSQIKVSWTSFAEVHHIVSVKETKLHIFF